MSKRYIDLKGPGGNAFYLIYTARIICYERGKTNEQTESVVDDMASSNYEHLCEVFVRNFGEEIDLVSDGKVINGLYK